MKSATTKDSKTSNPNSSSPFFNKNSKESFLSKTHGFDNPFFNAPIIQKKLTVGEPNDKYEEEADSLAEKVVQGAENTPNSLTLQRESKNSEPEEELQKKEEGLEENEVMRKSNFEGVEESSNNLVQTKPSVPSNQNLENQLQNSKGKGQPLSKEIRSEMENGLGADFEDVNVHTEESAVQMSKELNAQAFTSGKDIYFNRGKYKPENTNGKKLIAHELTHVVQQTGAGNQNKSETVQSKDEINGQKSKSKNPESPAQKIQLGTPKISLQRLPNGQEQMTQEVPFTQVIPQPASPGMANEEGQNQQEESIFVSKIEPATEILSSNSNSISSTLTHVASVASGRVPDPGNFGTTGASVEFSDVVIDSSFGTLFGSGVYTVTGNFVHTITYGVLSGLGPRRQVDIQGENDSDIKACNYQLVSSDLTPDMSSDNGRPPRTKYWSEDLTIRHERFHAVNQRQLSWGPQINTAMQNWLNARTSPSASHIRNTLLPQALNEGIRVYNAFVALPSAEGDTYGDGAPLYRARANAIKTKGDAGNYGRVSVRVTVHPKGGGTHEVVPGDTLWGIAQRIYGNGRYWRRIHLANPGKARNGGNLIFPGQIFDLPSINIDQELWLILQFGSSLASTSNVLIPAGSSHVFTELPNNLFDDTTNCSGNLNVEVLDVDANTLLNAIWAIPGNSNARNRNIEVNMEITGPAAGP